jgi:hypothetical protein
MLLIAGLAAVLFIATGFALLDLLKARQNELNDELRALTSGDCLKHQGTEITNPTNVTLCAGPARLNFTFRNEDLCTDGAKVEFRQNQSPLTNEVVYVMQQQGSSLLATKQGTNKTAHVALYGVGLHTVTAAPRTHDVRSNQGNLAGHVVVEVQTKTSQDPVPKRRLYGIPIPDLDSKLQ